MDTSKVMAPPIDKVDVMEMRAIGHLALHAFGHRLTPRTAYNILLLSRGEPMRLDLSRIHKFTLRAIAHSYNDCKEAGYLTGFARRVKA